MDRFVLGVTGGIAAGKSTLCKKLSKNGVYIIDADKISASILKKGTLAYYEVLKLFPKCFINGELDRRALGKIVFNDKEDLLKLNNITHPAIIEQIKKDVLSHRGIICIDAALLFETGLDNLCDRIWCVTAPENIRIERIIKRDSLTRQEAISRINSQMSDELRKSKSDVVIDSSITQEKYDNIINEKLEDIFKEMSL